MKFNDIIKEKIKKRKKKKNMIENKKDNVMMEITTRENGTLIPEVRMKTLRRE